MIHSIKGKIVEKCSDFVVLETNFISFQIFATGFLLEEVKIDEEIKLFTYLEVRENAIELYGFITKEDLKYFRYLRGISGIGPKSAINILSLVRISDLEKAIINENLEILTKVSGIGDKTARRIILELKGKILKKEFQLNELNGDDALIFDALIKLGYQSSQARQAIKKIPKEIIEIKERIKQALKILS